MFGYLLSSKEDVINQVKMRWNILVHAMENKRLVKLNDLDVIESNYKEIRVGCKTTGKVSLVFLRDEILQEHKPQIQNFKIRYFFNNGLEIGGGIKPELRLSDQLQLENRRA